MLLRIERRAESQAQEAVLWYEGQEPGLGRKFFDRFCRSLESIELNPQSFPLVESETGREFRYCLLKPYPYRIGFEVRSEEVIVTVVAHVRRDPRHWERQIRGERD